MMLRILMAKDLRRWWSDRNALLTTLLLPLLLTAVLGFSFGGFGDKAAISAIPLAAVGDVPDPVRDFMGNALRESGLFQLTWVDSARALSMVESGDVSAALLLPDDLMSDYFDGGVVEIGLWKDPTSNLKAGIVEQMLTRMILEVNAGEAAYIGAWPGDWYRAGAEDPIDAFFEGADTWMDVYRQARDRTPAAGSAWKAVQLILDHQVELADAMSRPAVSLVVEDRAGIEMATATDGYQSRNAFDYILPGMSVFFLMFAASAAGADLHRERENGSMRRLLTAPLSGVDLLLGKWLYAMVNGVVQLTVLLLLGRLLFKLNLGGDALALPLVVLATSAALSSFFLPLALITRSEKQMGQISTGLVLLMAILGGNFMSLEMMPGFMLKFSRLTPNYWANRGFNSLIAYDRSLPDVLPELGILAGYAAVFLIAAVLLLRRRGGREALL